MGDAHQVVVHDVGEIIGRVAVALEQDLVVQLLVVHFDIAVHEVFEAGLALVVYLLADHEGQALGKIRLHFGFGEAAAASVIAQDGAVVRFLAGLLLLLDLVAEAAVGVSALQQLFRVLFVKRQALALHVRADWAALVGALVVFQPGDGEAVIDHLHAVLHEPGLVGVLDAQDEPAFVLSRVQVRVQGGAQVADMHIPGGAGGKSRSYFHGVFLVSLFLVRIVWAAS